MPLWFVLIGCSGSRQPRRRIRSFLDNCAYGLGSPDPGVLIARRCAALSCDEERDRKLTPHVGNTTVEILLPNLLPNPGPTGDSRGPDFGRIQQAIDPLNLDLSNPSLSASSFPFDLVGLGAGAAFLVPNPVPDAEARPRLPSAHAA